MGPRLLAASSFGASLMAPVDVYRKVTPSVKYGALLLLLPCLVLFLFEVLGGLQVHPLQYLLVGLADCRFYLLPLSLAEHLPFTAAYAAAYGFPCATPLIGSLGLSTIVGPVMILTRRLDWYRRQPRWRPNPCANHRAIDSSGTDCDNRGKWQSATRFSSTCAPG